MERRVDLLTIIGLAMLLMPLLTMWHELGGHAAACLVQGGHLATISAFYVDCDPMGQIPDLVVAAAGVFVNIVAAIIAYLVWRSARSDFSRLFWWLVWVSEAFVAAGYFCFSGFSGFGDFGTGAGGSMASLPHGDIIRLAEIILGIVAYILVVRAGIRSLHRMIGTGPTTKKVRRTIAHGYYLTAGVGAVIVGLLNPVGAVITIMSAAASSFGGLAGFISIGFAPGRENAPRSFVIRRNWTVAILGVVALLGFALVLGPSIKF